MVIVEVIDDVVGIDVVLVVVVAILVFFVDFVVVVDFVVAIVVPSMLAQEPYDLDRAHFPRPREDLDSGCHRWHPSS